MTELQKIERSLPILQSGSRWLTRGQEALLMLMLRCLKEEQPVTADDIINIYTRFVQRNQHLEYTIYSCDYCNQEVEKFDINRDYTSWEIRDKAFGWLRHNVGSLVLKGYLKVIPRFSFEEDDGNS